MLPRGNNSISLHFLNPSSNPQPETLPSGSKTVSEDCLKILFQSTHNLEKIFSVCSLKNALGKRISKSLFIICFCSENMGLRRNGVFLVIEKQGE